MQGKIDRNLFYIDPGKNPKNIAEALKLELERNLREVKEILLKLDHEFFNGCTYEADPNGFSKYRVIVSMPFIDPIKIRCRVNEYSFSSTDDGYIGMKLQALGFYGFFTDSFTVHYHKKDLYKRLKIWYDLFKTIVRLLGGYYG